MNIIIIEFIIAIIGGIISGTLSAYLVNYIRLRPKIEICKEIATDKKGICKIKLINHSKYDAYGFLCYIVFTDPVTKQNFVIKWIDIPIIKGTLCAKKDEREFVSPVSPMVILEDKILNLPNESDIKKLYNEKNLSLKDFVNKNGELQMKVILSATNAKSGVNKLFVEKDMKIIPGVWRTGKNKVDSEDEFCSITH